MRKGLKEQIDRMIDKKVASVKTVKIPKGGAWYVNVDLHDLIFEILDYCGLSVSYTEPPPRKLTIQKLKK